MSARAELPPYTIAVRALCEFTAKAGDLDQRFTPSPSAQDGIAGHALVQSRRGPGYEAEVALAGRHRALAVRGRADGFDPARQRLEEIKTFRGDLARMPANHRALHWAQLKLYGALLCQARGLASLQLALVYLDIGSLDETVLVEAHTAADLQAFFEQHCERFLAWAQQELAHRAARDAALRGLAFAHAGFRPGQRALSEAVYRTAVRGRCLLAQAPTGIGKTIGCLFPLLKAAPAQRTDKLLYLTAKGSGRALALQALRRLGAGRDALPLRVVELVARDKSCEHPDKACNGASCPLAQGFYDRLPAARSAALADVAVLDKPALRAVALEHGICPYHLGQELVRWADVVVGDYNHYFDTSALLHGLTLANDWKVGLLVDEAHNLVGRARAMYSASLRQDALPALRRQVPPPLQRVLDRLERSWSALAEAAPDAPPAEPQPDGARHRPLPGVPKPFLASLQQAIAAIGEHLAEAPQAAAADAALLRFYFDALQFARTADSFGSHSVADLSWAAAGDGAVLSLRNVVPAPFLRPRFAAAQSSVLFSATLGPRRFQTDTLGLPDGSGWIDVASPFEAEQLDVHVVPQISTRYARRGASLAPIADLMARQHAAAPGNYLAFFSSFDYLEQAADTLQARHPDVPVWRQPRQMREAERDAFLARFAGAGRGIGFAVLGGAFGEGIDLPGDRLVGAFIATLGLPQRNAVNEQMKHCLDAAFGAGHDYAYLVPGLQKVVQAAGRVIRTPTDRGVLYLIDDRYREGRVRRLLPAWWRVQTLRALPAPAIRPHSS